MRKPGLLGHFLPGEQQQEELNLPEHPCATHHMHWHGCGRYSNGELRPSNLPALRGAQALAGSSRIRRALLKTSLEMRQVIRSDQASSGDKTSLQAQPEQEGCSPALDRGFSPSLALLQSLPRPRQGHEFPWGVLLPPKASRNEYLPQ